MKQLIPLSFLLLLVLFSCKKESRQAAPDSYSDKISNQLKDSLSEEDFARLDPGRAVISGFDNGAWSILRLPFLQGDIQTDFILLRIEKDGSFSRGRIIHLVENRTDSAGAGFNGKLSVYSLQRRLTTYSAVTHGYVESYQQAGQAVHEKPQVVPIPSVTLPDVVFVSSYGSGGWSASNWYNIVFMLMETNIYAGGGSGSGGGGGGGGGGNYTSSVPGSSGTTGGSPQTQNPMHVDFERDDLPAIDVNKFIKCFSAIPDRGATCTIRILTDIPVDTDPSIFFEWTQGSPGHSFIQITKTNGSQTVQQNIGFYPASPWAVLSPIPIDGKFVDNADHEFNASLTMDLTPVQLQNTLAHIQVLAKTIVYDIVKSNCTDFALDVFNYQRGSNPLIIRLFDVPGTNAPNGSKSPQGLYLRLKAIKEKTTNPESKNVSIPGVKGFAGNSHGPCN